MNRAGVIFQLLLLSFSLAIGAQADADFSSTRQQALQELIQWQKQIEVIDTESFFCRQWVDRLIFKVERSSSEKIDSHWVKKMIQTEINLERQQAASPTLDFLTQLESALSEILEPSENPLTFVRTYTEFSGVLNPSSNEKFASERAYLNGPQSEKADVWEPEDAGDLVASISMEDRIETLDFIPETVSSSPSSYLQTPSFQYDPVLDHNPNPSLPQMEPEDPNGQNH